MKKLFAWIIATFMVAGLALGQNVQVKNPVKTLQKFQSYQEMRNGSGLPAPNLPGTGFGREVTDATPTPDAPNAWVSTWYFSQTPGTYTAITGGTVLGTTSNDEQTFGPYNIGFTFAYNGTNYTQFSVATNGFIGLGGTVVTTANLPISGGTSNNIISALGMNLAGQTGSTLQYLQSGTSPNRTLTIQWTAYRRSGLSDNFNFQITLNENNNSIVFKYGSFTVASGTNSTAQVGLRGASNTEYNNRLVSVNNATTTYVADWELSNPGTANTSNCRIRSAAYPLTGQTYGWTPYLAQTKTLPIIENFDGVATATLPVGWSVENTNADLSFTWMNGSWYPNSGANSMFCFYNINGTTAMNDWFFSPKVSLVSGHTYRVSFYYSNAPTSTSYPERLEVKYGATATSGGMTSTAIFSNASVTGEAYQLGTASFVASATADVYFGWHGYSLADEFLLFVDDIVIEEVFTHDVASVGLMNPVKIMPGQQMPWLGRVKNNGQNTETFPVDTRLRENTVLSSTQTNTVTSLAPSAYSTLSGNFNIAALGAGSSFDLAIETKLATDVNASNNILTQYTRPCVKDTIYAWDDGVSEGSVGYGGGAAWLGQLYYLSAQDTLTSITVKWGTIPGTFAGNSFEIYNVSGGVPTTKFADIITGISLGTTDAATWHTYKASSPVILPAGTYWIGVHQTATLADTYILADDATGLTAESFVPGFAFYTLDGSTWNDYTASSLYMYNVIRPNFAVIHTAFVANPTNFAATPVSSSEIDLTWELNGNSNNVLVAWNTTNTFGTPVNGTTYSAGNTIAGGGTVLQYNNATFFNHTGLSPTTTYYYKAWSYDGSIYSGGTTDNATTFCAETPAPWTQDFEGSTFPPTCWLMSAGTYAWARSTACSGYGTGSASVIADFYNTPAQNSFALFSMPFNKGTMTAPALAFDFAYATYAGEVDELDIYYSTDGGGTFQLLEEMPGGMSGVLNTAGSTTSAFVPASDQWATQTLILPIGTNMVAFNAISAYGNNLYIDNIRIVEGLLHDVGVKKLDDRDVYNVGTITPTAIVKNYGGSVETFTVTMTIGTYTSTQTVTGLAPGLTSSVNFDPWTAVAGNYTMTVTTNLVGDLNAENNTMTKPVRVMVLNKQVYGYTTFSTTDNGPLTFNLNDPGTLTELVNEYPVTSYPAGGAWANDTWYASIYAAAAPYNLVTFNTTTGARTVIGDMGVNINAMSYNKVNGKMYGAGYANSKSVLYTINLATGLATKVDTIGSYLIINMAINNSGVCYATDLASNVLGTINLTTAAFTSIGSIGFDANYAQDMEFDRNTGELYMAAYGETGQLRWVNTATGNTMLIGDFQDGAEVTGFAIPDVVIPPLTLDGTPVNATCHGGSNGSITTSVSGGVTPYGYLWSNSATTADLAGIPAGTYTVTVTDAASSTISGSWTVNQPSAIGLNATVTNATCPNTADGSIDLSVSGGTPGYTYAWSNSTSGQDINNVLPGTYTVMVTDAVGCTATGNWNVGYNDAVCNYEYPEGSVTTYQCFDAHYTITVAGPGKTFTVVQPNGHVLLIAAQNILLEEGTKVELGAYLHAYISTTFCDGIPPPLPAVATGTEEMITGVSHPSFTLYPNPTSGNVILSTKGDRIPATVKVEVYNMSGNRIMTEQITGQKQHEFSFSDLPFGMYFVRILADDYVETIKVIKTR